VVTIRPTGCSFNPVAECRRMSRSNGWLRLCKALPGASIDHGGGCPGRAFYSNPDFGHHHSLFARASVCISSLLEYLLDELANFACA